MKNPKNAPIWTPNIADSLKKDSNLKQNAAPLFWTFWTQIWELEVDFNDVAQTL